MIRGISNSTIVAIIVRGLGVMFFNE